MKHSIFERELSEPELVLPANLLFSVSFRQCFMSRIQCRWRWHAPSKLRSGVTIHNTYSPVPTLTNIFPLRFHLIPSKKSGIYEWNERRPKLQSTWTLPFKKKKNNFGTHELYLSHSLSTFLAIIIKPLQLSPLSSQLIMLPWFIWIISMQTLELFSSSYHKYRDELWEQNAVILLQTDPDFIDWELFFENMICKMR